MAQKRFHKCICLSVGFTHVRILLDIVIYLKFKLVNIVEKKVHNLFSNQTIFKFLNINTEYNTILNKCFDLVFSFNEML